MLELKLMTYPILLSVMISMSQVACFTRQWHCLESSPARCQMISHNISLMVAQPRLLRAICRRAGPGLIAAFCWTGIPLFVL